jgi:hypothetical protein
LSPGSRFTLGRTKRTSNNCFGRKKKALLEGAGPILID